MKTSPACLGLAVALGSRLVVAQPNDDLSAGGLAPPPAIDPEPEVVVPTETERDLSRAEEEDSGRGLSFFWVDAEAGYEFLGLRTFRDGGLVDGALVKSTQHGPVFGAALGARLIAFTVGARFRYAHFQESSRWSLNLEGGYRLPLGRLEPYFTLGGGYTSLNAFEIERSFVALKRDLRVHGFNLRGSAGVDYFFGSALSLGANLSGDLLFLTRPAVEVSAGEASLSRYLEDGSSIGASTDLTIVVGLHF